MKPVTTPPVEADSTENLISNMEVYIRSSVELVGIEASVKAIQVLSSGLHAALACGLLLFFLLFSGLGLGWWIGEGLHNMKIGFIAVGGFYLIVLVPLVLLRSPILRHLRNYLTKRWYEQDKNL